VVTGGIAARHWKVEASAFNGREPDEQRWDLDAGAFDSFSARLSFAPTETLTTQVSAGHLHDSEAGIASQPRTDVNRATASAVLHKRIRTNGLLAVAAAYGANWKRSAIPDGILEQVTHAALLEGSATFGERHTWFGRLELVGKPAHDLHVHELVTMVFPIGKLQGGYVRYLRPWYDLVPGVGGTVSAAVVPSSLAPRYGGHVAPGFGVFVTLRPAAR
jgi:hypothetical protein